jgi:hypothetical protein
MIRTSRGSCKSGPTAGTYYKPRQACLQGETELYRLVCRLLHRRMTPATQGHNPVHRDSER